MKSLGIIFVVLIVGIIFIVIYDLNSNPTMDKSDYNEISWRAPIDDEIKKIRESFFLSDIDICTTYFLKKINGNKYLIACEAGDGAWSYYTAYLSHKKVYRTPQDLAISIMPPENLLEQQANYPEEKDLEVSGKTGSSRESMEAR